MTEEIDHNSRMASAVISEYVKQIEHERELAKRAADALIYERARIRGFQQAVVKMRKSLDWCLRMMESARPPEDVQHIREALDFTLDVAGFAVPASFDKDEEVFKVLRGLFRDVGMWPDSIPMGPKDTEQMLEAVKAIRKIYTGGSDDSS